MSYRASLRGETFAFADLRELLAKANEEKSGDQLAGLAAGSELERVAAKLALADVTLGEIADTPVVEDDVTELIHSGQDRARFSELRSVTVGELREMVLSRGFARVWEDGLAWALTPEMAAAVAKLMSNKDLIVGAAPAADRHALPQHDGRARRARLPHPAQPPDRRPGRHPGLDTRRAAVRLRRRGHRREPGQRVRLVGRGRGARAAGGRRAPGRADADLRASPTSRRSSRRCVPARRSICCSSRSPARRAPTRASASRSTCSPRAARRSWPTTPRVPVSSSGRT